MPSKEDALTINQIAKMAGVNRNAVVAWVAEGLLIDQSPVPRYHIFDRKEVEALIEVRSRNPHDWKNSWKEERKMK